MLISLKKNELVYDIEFMTYKVAKIHFLESAPQSAADVAVGVDDRDFVDRLLESAVANVKRELQWCVDDRLHDAVTDMVSPDKHEYDIILNLDFKGGNVAESLCSAIHDYVVHYAVYRFLLMSVPGIAPDFAALAETDLNRVYSLARTNQKYKYYSLWNANK